MRLEDVDSNNERDRAGAEEPPRGREPADRRLTKDQEPARRLAAVTELVRGARANGDSLTGPSGLLTDRTKMVL